LESHLGRGYEADVTGFGFGRGHSVTGFACLIHLVMSTCGHHGVPSYQNPDLLGKQKLQVQHS
jgi:hypothetical protein